MVRWIYLIGALSAANVVQTVEDYRINEYRLDFSLGMCGGRNHFKTGTYHVLVIGTLIHKKDKGDTILVHAMYDSPDITGRGIVNCKRKTGFPLNRKGTVRGRPDFPCPFMYLPAKAVSAPKNVEKMLSPILFYNKMDHLDFPRLADITEDKEIRYIEIILTEHGDMIWTHLRFT